jgi:dolichol-phosphate mannosyltransferase
MNRTLVYVPVFNQVNELPTVLYEIDKSELDGIEFLLVDNGSSDGTEALILASKHHKIRVPSNRGVGYSYMLALEWALDHGFDRFAAMAGNAKMLPGEIPRLLHALDLGADYVTGSRFLPGGAHPNLPRFRRLAIPGMNLIARLTTGRRLTDATNGFRAFRLDLMKKARFDWRRPDLWRYGFEYFLYAKVLRDPNLVSVEVPTTMRYPASGKYSKIRPGLDWASMIAPWIKARIDASGFDQSSS